MSSIDIKTLLEAGAHFGHKTSRWNPKMAPYIHSKRGGIHIIDLEQTVECLESAAKFAASVSASGKKVLFVGTKKHVAPAVVEAAERAGMPYVAQRWFGGMLTNFSTISERVKRLKQLDEQLDSGELSESYNKREILEFTEERDSLAKNFTGIAAMSKLPGALFITDVLTEKTAVREARRLNIPVIAIVDTNGDPNQADYIIPANDDALKTVKLITDTVADAVINGAKEYSLKAEEPAPKPKTETSKVKKDSKSSSEPDTESKTEAGADSQKQPAAADKPKTKAKPATAAKAKPKNKPKTEDK